MTWSLIESGHRNAYDNMAIDEAVFGVSMRCCEPAPVLRFYGWEPSAISIGYFQPARELDGEREARAGIDLVRRATGGSAILHKDELTYCLCIESLGLAGRRATEMLYIATHKALMRAFGSLGAPVRMRGDDATPAAESSPFCFAKPTKFDIMVGDRKLVGSAQRRRGRLLLQHGSIPICGNHDVPHATCLEEATGQTHPFAEVVDCVRDGFASQFHTRLETRSLYDAEHELAMCLAETKYRTPAWTFRR